ncbi:radical SAM protein [archaeon]|nr:radical SAM protein [archaeon]
MRPRFYAKAVKAYLLYRLNKNVPFIAHLHINLSCNLTCKHCSIVQHARKKKISNLFSKEDILSAIDEISKVGTPIVSVIGGEPMLDKNTEEFGKRIKSKGMYSILTTNGTFLTEERAKKVVESFDCVRISVDGLKETHDLIRGKGNFEKTLRGIEYLNSFNKRNKSKIMLNFVVQKDNEKEMEAVQEFFKDKCEGVTFIPHSTSNGIYHSKNIDSSWKNLNMNKKTGNTDDFISGKPSLELGKLYCDGGRSKISILPNGDVSPCLLTFNKMGNLSKKGLKSILNSEKPESLKKSIKNCEGCYNVCTTQLNQVLNMNPLK